jgi:chromosome segregation ATPase
MTGQRIHISSARLRNFLSFYEGTVSFDQGLTVIVGPNGSGKTSIFHALKFALGSNEKESRYSKWSDFVRHGASSAEVEVTLTVDGQDRRLLRKIDRDGIPRAFVDGRRVRAVDLRSLTESLGLEPDNTLVFMPQERINALRDMDPIEVRKLVEEGTGLDVSRDRIVLQETQVTQTRSKLESAIAESKAVEGEIGLLQRDLARLEKKRSLQRAEREQDVEVKWASLDDLVIQI